MYTNDYFMREFSKSLGDTEARLLASLASQDKSAFTFSDAKKVSGLSENAARLILSDLVKKNWLIRLSKGKYLIVPFEAGEAGEHTENWYVIAKNLIEPKSYYISHYSALDVHEMVVQPVMTVYISTPTRRIPKEILGASYRFIYLPADDLWGNEDVWVTPSQKVKVSDLERTILDCLDRPDLCGGISEVAKGIWKKRGEIDNAKLVAYAKRLGKKAVAKRLGFLLENYSLGSEEALVELREMITPSYTLLDSTLPKTGKHLSKWRVQINLEPEELKEITRT